MDNVDTWEKFHFEADSDWGKITPSKPLPCPKCSDLRIEMQQADFIRDPDAEWRRAERIQNSPYIEDLEDKIEFESDLTWDFGECILRLKCGKCSLSIFCIGRYRGHRQGYDSLYGEVFQDSFLLYPRFFSTPPNIIDLPKKTPQEVTNYLFNSFELYWCDTASCANKIRISIELLLDYYKIPRTKPTGGKIALHNRIEDYLKNKAGKKRLSQRLLAIKWIGNEGSHLDTTRRSVIEAYKLLEDVLVKTFGEKEKKLKEIEDGINANKGSRN